MILNVVSSAFFLVALAVLYGMMGTLNMADIAAKAALVENQGLLTLCAMIFMVVFGFKSAIFPIYFWLPKSYVEPPAAVSALFGGLLTKVGVYALVRVFTLIFIHDTSFTHTILLWIGGITMFLGVMAAVAQMNFKHILSSHIISQIGYMLMGLGIFTVSSIAGTIFFLAHNIIVKTALFLAEGATERITGTAELKQMGGLLSRYPVLGWGFFLAGISLAGVPPLSGFWGKLLLLESAAEADHYWMMAIAIIVGFFTLFSMMKIFIYVYWGKEKTWPQLGFDYKKLLPGCLLLVAVSIAMGLAVEPMYHIAQLAANQLMTPEQYIQAVLTTAGTR